MPPKERTPPSEGRKSDVTPQQFVLGDGNDYAVSNGGFSDSQGAGTPTAKKQPFKPPPVEETKSDKSYHPAERINLGDGAQYQEDEGGFEFDD